MVTKSQRKAVQKYNTKNYDQIAIRVPKGKREAYKKKAENNGKSLAQYIVDLIENDK